MNKKTDEKIIFRTLHLILETQEMIEVCKSYPESERDYFDIRDLEGILISLIRDINDDLLPYNIGLFALNLDEKQNRY